MTKQCKALLDRKFGTRAPSETPQWLDIMARQRGEVVFLWSSVEAKRRIIALLDSPCLAPRQNNNSHRHHKFVNAL